MLWMLAALPLLIGGPIVAVQGAVVVGLCATWTGLMVFANGWLDRRRRG